MSLQKTKSSTQNNIIILPVGQNHLAVSKLKEKGVIKKQKYNTSITVQLEGAQSST